jgi:hypothetical protein
MHSPCPSFDPLPLELHVFRSERPPRRYRNAYITVFSPIGVPVCAWRKAAFATVTGARVFAASCLLQQIPEARWGLQLYRGLHHLFRMASAGAMAMFVVVTAAVVATSVRLVLVVL